MLVKKCIILILIVLTFLSPVLAVNIDLEITNQDYQTIRSSKNMYDNDLNNATKYSLKNKYTKSIDTLQATTLKTIGMDCNSVHTSKLSFNATDNNDLNILLLAKPAYGKVKINSDGTFTYIPYMDYRGIDSFCYVATTKEGPRITEIKFNIQ
ncbi:MAG: Ig-like domain-containing protein [Methanobacterium sp. ERen5]|nr:MAG: Ig-like domain-containing protein [Methanobacterium sp. ERen5]